MFNWLAQRKKLVSTTLIIIGVICMLFVFGATAWGELSYLLLNVINKNYVLDTSKEPNNLDYSVFGELLSKSSSMKLIPANKDFSLVVEKIGLNVPVVLGVSVTDTKAYTEALRHGVAHAMVSDIPSSQPGNVYLFAHSSLNFFSLGKYATAFNLVRKLENGDRINVFFKGKRFEYEVVNKEVYPGWNTYPLNRKVIEPLLTLQTCDPPGTTLNRLVVTAKLVKTYEE